MISCYLIKPSEYHWMKGRDNHRNVVPYNHKKETTERIPGNGYSNTICVSHEREIITMS